VIGGSDAIKVETNRTATRASIIWSAATSSAHIRIDNNQTDREGDCIVFHMETQHLPPQARHPYDWAKPRSGWSAGDQIRCRLALDSSCPRQGWRRQAGTRKITQLTVDYASRYKLATSGVPVPTIVLFWSVGVEILQRPGSPQCVTTPVAPTGRPATTS
jgi:hypothetical protein